MRSDRSVWGRYLPASGGPQAASTRPKDAVRAPTSTLQPDGGVTGAVLPVRSSIARTRVAGYQAIAEQDVAHPVRRGEVGVRRHGSEALPLRLTRQEEERSDNRQRSYQCTPFMRCAIAIASPEAFSPSPFSPLAAEESGKTL